MIVLTLILSTLHFSLFVDSLNVYSSSRDLFSLLLNSRVCFSLLFPNSLAHKKKIAINFLLQVEFRTKWYFFFFYFELFFSRYYFYCSIFIFTSLNALWVELRLVATVKFCFPLELIHF